MVLQAFFVLFLIGCTQLQRQHLVELELHSTADRMTESSSWLLFIEWSLGFYVTAWLFESIEDMFKEIREIYDHSDHVGEGYMAALARLHRAVRRWRGGLQCTVVVRSTHFMCTVSEYGLHSTVCVVWCVLCCTLDSIGSRALGLGSDIRDFGFRGNCSQSYGIARACPEWLLGGHGFTALHGETVAREHARS